MPFSVPIFGVSLFDCCQFVSSVLHNNLIGGGAAHLEKCDVIVVTIRSFSRKRMLVLDQSSCVFTTLQQSLRIQKDSILGIMEKDWCTTFRYLSTLTKKSTQLLTLG